MQIAVIGAGSLGTLLGGILAHDGNDVQLIHHREEYVRKLDRNGVRVEGDAVRDAPFVVDVPATTDAGEVGHVDLGIVVVRSHQTREALMEHEECLGPDTRLLTLQNGLTNLDTLREVVTPRRAFGGITFVGAEREAPGVVRNTNMGPTTVGGPDRRFADRIGETFRSAGLGDVTVVEDPIPYIWDKQMVSLAFKPVAALTRLRNGPIVDDDDLVWLIERVVSEARTVARARGIELPTDDIVGRIVETGRNSPDHRSSMLQDVAAGRKTEIDDINRAIVAYADAEGVEVPFNRALSALVEGLERAYLDEP
jgi:2-dehydropantoate 2-reductase